VEPIFENFLGVQKLLLQNKPAKMSVATINIVEILTSQLLLLNTLRKKV